MIVDPNVIFNVESKHKPIGFSITLPDVNLVLKKVKGRLFPFGIYHLLTGLKKNYRIWALGIIKFFQRKGIDTVLYYKTYEVLKPKAQNVELNYVLEDNSLMRHTIEKLGFTHNKSYRIYEMEIV